MVAILISTFLPFWDEQMFALSEIDSFLDIPVNNFWGKISDAFDKFKILSSFSIKVVFLILSPLFILISLILCFTKVFKFSNLYDDFPRLSTFFFWLSIAPIFYVFFFDKTYFKIFKYAFGVPGFYLVYIGVGMLSNVNLSKK